MPSLPLSSCLRLPPDLSAPCLCHIQIHNNHPLDLRTKIEAEATTYVNTKVDYEQNLRFFNSDLTYSNIVTEPFPADKKAFPVRWVVVALSALGAMLLSILVIFIIENRKRFVAESK